MIDEDTTRGDSADSPGIGTSMEEGEIIHQAGESDAGQETRKDPTYSARRHQKEKRSADKIDEELVNYLKKPKVPQDEFYYFGMSIAQQLRDLKPEVAGLGKIRISEVMYNLQFPQFTADEVETVQATE